MKPTRIILIIILAYVLYVGGQYISKHETATQLLKQTTNRLETASFDSVLKELKDGYNRKVIIKGGKKFWLTCHIKDTGFKFVKDLPHKNYILSEKTRERKLITHAVIVGKLEYVELLPTSTFKLGMPFRINLKRK